jgi:hypothetical protein
MFSGLPCGYLQKPANSPQLPDMAECRSILVFAGDLGEGPVAKNKGE